MNELPPNWTMASIDELGEIRLGKMLDRAKNQGLAAEYLRNINVRWFHFDLADLRKIFVSEEEKYLLSVEDGDVFICEGGEPGRCAVWRGGSNALVYQKALHRFRTNGAVVPDLLMYRVRHDADTGALAGAFTGTTIKHLTRESLAGFQISVPPIPEQKRIADKLDAVLARVDACREGLDRVPDILKRFRQAVLAAAVSGRLTANWRAAQPARTASQADPEDVVAESAAPGYGAAVALDSAALHPGCDHVWPISSVDAVASAVFDGPFGSHLKSNDYSENGIRVVRLENIGWLQFFEEKRTYIAPEKYESLKRHTLRADDVLVSSFISEEVRVCLLPDELSGTAINKADCLCVRTNPIICLPSFLAICLASPSTFVALKRSIHGATRPRVNLRQLRQVQLSLPSIPEQQEIIRRVETLFAYADRLEARYAAARAEVERLTPALLGKAFRGELVPQDPKDEPASVLLERIRAARAAAPGKPRRRSSAHSDRQVEKAKFVPPSRASLASVAKLEPGNDEGNADDARVDPHLIGAS